MRSKRARAVVAIAAVVTLSFGGVASAGYILVSGKVNGDKLQRPGVFQAEVKTNNKGKPLKLNFIEFRARILCGPPPSEPPLLLVLEQHMPVAKVQKQGKKYVFFSEEEGSATMSGKISKNGKRLSGTAEFLTDLTADGYVGYDCDAKVRFNAKSIFVSGG
ncbi:MAG: hypothetical protein ACRDLO_16035 [Solirubrobacterales bacterium]